MQILGALLLIAALGLAVYGWGRWITRWAYVDDGGYPAFAAVVGVAVLTALGGWLNLLKIAYGPALAMALLVGWGLAAVTLRRDRAATPVQAGKAPSFSRTDLIVGLALLSLAVFFAATLMPAQAFNFHDDFHTYFSRPLRMLATGSLGGDPFDLLGVDSLGGQAYWHAFFAYAAAPSWLNGFDAVFCFLLAGWLLIDMRRRLAAPATYLFAAALAFVVINPQTVNVSALFSGVAMMLGIAFAAMQPATPVDRRHVPLGLLLAALVALKTTFIVLVGVFVVVYFALRAWREGVPALKAAATTAAVAALALLPWFALHLRQYLDIATARLDDGASGPPSLDVWATILSAQPLFYGGRAIYYALVIALLGIGAVVALFAARARSDQAHPPFLAVVVALSAGALATFPASAIFMDPGAALRYTCPALIAAFPFLLLAFSRLPTAPFSTRPIHVGAWAASGIALLLAGLFADSFAARLDRAYQTRTAISFPTDADYLRYNDFSLGEGGRQRILAAQARVPAGQPLLAWVSAPFQLDFSRNPVLLASEPGWMNRWLDLPFGDPPEALRAYFLARGVRHLLLEYRGYGVPDEARYRGFMNSPFPLYRRLGQANLYMYEAWRRLGQTSRLLYHSGGVVVIDLASAPPNSLLRGANGQD